MEGGWVESRKGVVDEQKGSWIFIYFDFEYLKMTNNYFNY